MKLARLFPLLIAATVVLHAAYDGVLFKMHAKVFPKMVMTDTKIAEKTIDGTIVVGIVYDKNELGDAQYMEQLITELYPQIGAYPLQVRLIPYQRFDGSSEPPASALFLLNSNPRNIQNAVRYAKEHALVTYAYNPAYLNQGVLMSLYIERKARPYLNLSEAKAYNIRFSSILLKIAKLL